MFSLEKKKDTEALCNSLWFLLVATDEHIQKKAHGHQHGRACPSSSPCNVRADFVQEKALRKQGEIVSGGAYVPHYKRTWKWILWKPVSASKKKKKKVNCEKVQNKIVTMSKKEKKKEQLVKFKVAIVRDIKPHFNKINKSFWEI